MLEAVIWDADGVLFDSEDLYFEAMREVLGNHGHDLNKVDYVRHFMLSGKALRGVIKQHSLDVNYSQLRSEKEDIVDRMFSKGVKLMPYAQDLVDELEMWMYTMAIATGSEADEMDLKLEKVGLNETFGVVVSAGNYEHKKPHPEPFQVTMQKIRKRYQVITPKYIQRSTDGYPSFNPENIVVIEDNPSGVVAAKRAGCKVVAYPNKFTGNPWFAENFPEEAKQFEMADVRVGSLSEVNAEMLEALCYRPSEE